MAGEPTDDRLLRLRRDQRDRDIEVAGQVLGGGAVNLVEPELAAAAQQPVVVVGDNGHRALVALEVEVGLDHPRQLRLVDHHRGRAADVTSERVADPGRHRRSMHAGFEQLG